MAFTPYNYMPPSYGLAQETEEERRRREQAELASGAAAPVSPDLVSAEPTDFGAQPEPAAPAEPTQPAAGELKMVNGRLQRVTEAEPQAIEMPAMPEPGPGVQVAGPAQMPPPAPRYTGPSQGAEAQTVSQPPAAPVQPAAPAAQPAPQTSIDRVWSEAGQDPAKFLAIRNDTSLPVEIRRLAGREASRLALMDGDRSDQENAVREKMQSAMQSGNFNEIAKMMKSRGEEGSWGRRVLYGLLGMEAAVKDEEAKLGIGAKWSTTPVTDPKTGETRNVLLKTRADGLPIEGYDATTGARLDAKSLAGVTTGAQKLNIVGGTYVNDRTGEVGRVITDERTGTSYIQTDKGRKPMAGFRPQASAGTLDMQRVAQIQRQNVDLASDWAKLQMRVQGAAPEAANRFLGEFNAKFGTNYALSQLGGSPPQISLDTGEMTAAPRVAPAAQPAAAAAPAQPAAQPAAAAAPTAGQAPAVVAPVSPQQIAPSTGRVGAPGAVRMPAGTTPAAIQQQQALSQRAGEQRIETEATIERETRKPGAQARGKIEAKDINNQNYADSTYGLIKPISDSIRQSTGSGIGTGVDKLASVIGVGTRGAENIAKLEVLGYQLLSNVPRFEGPQSDIDVQLYKQAAGDLSNSNKPVNVRLAALDSIVMMLKKYDKAGTNDWTFGQTGGNIRIIRRERVQ